MGKGKPPDTNQKVQILLVQVVQITLVVQEVQIVVAASLLLLTSTNKTKERTQKEILSNILNDINENRRINYA